MSICNKCHSIMSDSDYAAEGMCHECYYFEKLDKDDEYTEDAQDSDESDDIFGSFDGEAETDIEKYVEQMLEVLKKIKDGDVDV